MGGTLEHRLGPTNIYVLGIYQPRLPRLPVGPSSEAD